MEVGHQHVHAAEHVPRIDEQRRLSPHRPERPAGRGALQRPQGRGADAHHPPAARPRPRHRLARRRRNLQPLAMQDVRFDLLAAERGEGPRPDVQGDPRDLDAAVLDRREHRLVEMQAGGGRGDRARPARVHRLVAIRVPGVRLAADVRGQRHRPGPFQEPRDPARTGELQLEQLAAPGPHHESVVVVHRQEDAASGRLARTQPGEHPVGREDALDQDLDPTAGGPGREAPAPDHPRVVDHDDVGGHQVLDEVGEPAVGNLRRGPAEDEQAAVAAPGSGMLRDQLGRQIE